jgi:anti-sigma factor RsiW
VTCQQFIECLLDYQSGELAGGERAEFAAHLAKCASCVTYLRTYELTIHLSKAVFTTPSQPLPLNVPEDLIQAILAARAKAAP